MLLNADILFDCLSEYVKLAEYGRRKTELVLKRPVLYTSQTDRFESDRVYIALSEDLPKSPELEDGVVVICVGSRPPSPYTTGRCCCFVVLDDTDLLNLTNLAHGIFDKFDQWEQDIQRVLSEDFSIQRLVDVSEAVIENPIVVIDTDYRFLAYSSMIDSMEELSDFQPDHDGKYDPEYLSASIRGVDANMTTVEPFLIESNLTGKGKCFSFSMNLFVKRKYVGNLKVAFFLRPWRKSDNILCQYLVRNVEKALEKHEKLTRSGTDILRDIYTTLLKGLPLSKAKQQYLLAGTPNSQYVCMRFVLGERSFRKVPVSYICDHIESVFQGSIAFPYDSSIVAFVDLQKAKMEISELGSEIKALLKSMNLKVGISNVYSDVRDTRNYYREACVAFEMGSTLDPQWSYYRFADYTLRYMMYSCMGEFASEMLYTQGYSRLVEHDRLSQTNYVDTLRCYLNNNMNIAQTAKDLYVHRSTLLERLKRIENLLDADLKDPDQRLQLAIILKISQIRDVELQNKLQTAPESRQLRETKSKPGSDLKMQHSELEKLL